MAGSIPIKLIEETRGNASIEPDLEGKDRGRGDMEILSQGRPFLKWAGGKSQIIDQLDKLLPSELKKGKVDVYYEPFIGGGAMFFHVVQSYKIKRAILADINKELILVYRVVKNSVHPLIRTLRKMEERYHSLTKSGRRAYFYEVRGVLNAERCKFDYAKYSASWIERASQIIFLNKTCFNGLFRLNRAGAFNSPYGDYKNPRILDEENLLSVSTLLRECTLLVGDFSSAGRKIPANSFVYLDPPYRPLSKTASFTSYSQHCFDDREQIRLAAFFRKLDKLGAKLMLSNSDPKNLNPNDEFIEDLYMGYRIFRIRASRMINCVATKRGKISELVITNY